MTTATATPNEQAMNYKYQVIASASQWAIVDFGLSIAKAKKCLKAVKFADGRPALQWCWGFARRSEAQDFVSRCQSGLAFKSGRIGRWITPTFAVVETRELNTR